MSSFDNSDAEFQRHSQFISTSVQKIYQNGEGVTGSLNKSFRFLNFNYILVSSMNRMVNQVGTAQETPEIRQQL
jgi:hypothetical protein